MKNVGFNFTTNDFRYCVLENQDDEVQLLEKDKIIYPANQSTVDRAGWLETQICLLLDKENRGQVYCIRVKAFSYSIFVGRGMEQIMLLYNRLDPLYSRLAACFFNRIFPKY